MLKKDYERINVEDNFKCFIVSDRGIFMRKKQRSLSAQNLIKIAVIFEKQKWKIEEKTEGVQSLYNRFCERVLDLGDNKSRELFLELSERYIWIKQEQYLDLFIGELKKLVMCESGLKEDSTIYIIPLIAPKDKGKIKSSFNVSYLINDVKIRQDAHLYKFKYKLVVDAKKTFLEMKDDDLIVFVDDFIGTGNTAIECLVELEIESYKKIKIITLVTQEEGKELIEAKGVTVYSSLTLGKQMTDYYQEDELKQKLEIMKRIEAKLSVTKDYQMGYKGSESLVTMIRTPNNTFPVFWEEKNGFELAPFPRF